jgi:hypothetical protein
MLSASDRIGKSRGLPNRGALASYRICSPQTQKDTLFCEDWMLHGISESDHGEDDEQGL